MSVRAGQFGIASEQRHLKCLGKRDVRCIIGGQRIAQLPDSWHERLVFVAFDAQLGQVLQRVLGPCEGDFLALHQAPQNLGDMHALRGIKGPVHQLSRMLGLESLTHFFGRGNFDNLAHFANQRELMDRSGIRLTAPAIAWGYPRRSTIEAASVRQSVVLPECH